MGGGWWIFYLIKKQVVRVTMTDIKFLCGHCHSDLLSFELLNWIKLFFSLFKKQVVTIRLAPIVHLGGTWGGVSGKRRAANGKRRAANGKRQTGNQKSWSLISDKFQQFATMLFSQWPLAYTKLRNTEICKKAEDFRKSSIFTIMNIFFIFGSDKEK